MRSCRSEKTTVHGTAVRLMTHGVLITGASGSGKSSLALQLMAMGAELIADDRTTLQRDGMYVIASCPETIRGMIEARGIGILNAQCSEPAKVSLVIDMDTVENQRIPEPEFATLCGVQVRCIHKTDNPGFPAAVLQYLKAGAREARK